MADVVRSAFEYRKQLAARPDAAVARLAAQQHGVVSVAQLRATGLTHAAISRRVAAGRLIRLHRGVYAVGHGRLVREGFWLAAVLACGRGAVLSHRDAAALHGLRPCNRTRVEVTAGGAGRGLRGIQVHTGRLAAPDVTTARGIPVTTPARTLLDLAEVVPADHLARALERAAQLRLYDGRAIRAALARAPGRRGQRPLRAALAALHPATGRTRSDTELRALALIGRHRLPEPEVNTVVEGLEVDLLWRDHGVVAELDSRTFHLTPQAFERDHRRDARLQAAGYRVARFTWRQVADEPDEVARCLAAVLAAPSPGRP